MPTCDVLLAAAARATVLRRVRRAHSAPLRLSNADGVELVTAAYFRESPQCLYGTLGTLLVLPHYPNGKTGCTASGPGGCAHPGLYRSRKNEKIYELARCLICRAPEAGGVRYGEAAIASLLSTLLSEDTMVTLCELRDRITEDQITQGEVMAALREPLAGTDDRYVRSKLKQAITSANIYYSSRKWGHCRTLETGKGSIDCRHNEGHRVIGTPPLRGDHFSIRDSGIFDAGKHRKNSLTAWLPDLLGRAAQSSPEAAPRRAEGAGLYGNGANRAMISDAAMCRIELRPPGRALPLRPSASSLRRPSASTFLRSGERIEGSSPDCHAGIRSAPLRGPAGCGSARGSRTD